MAKIQYQMQPDGRLKMVAPTEALTTEQQGYDAGKWTCNSHDSRFAKFYLASMPEGPVKRGYARAISDHYAAMPWGC